jgi:transcriptional regulator with XRE-family HTH domain
MPEEHRSQRQRLGTELRKLRKLAGLNGYQLAEQVGISQSKVSRIEASSAVPTVREAEAWARAVGASDEVLANLVGLAEAALTEFERWRMALRHGLPHLQAEVRALEANARRISNFQPSLVPGLLQTAEYARRVFRLADVVGGQDYAGAVAARMSRQEILFDEDRRFEFLVTEGALRWRPGPPKLLLAQLDRVSSVATLSNVSLGLMPQDAEATAVASHGFAIYGDRENDGEPFVRVEMIHGELTVSDPEDVAIYRERFSRLSEAAVFDEDARTLLARIADDLRRKGPS